MNYEDAKTLLPTEPDCIDEDGHDWQSPYKLVGGLRENPGVWGRGGNVVVQEACVKCGCGRITDTWTQNPSDGVTSITYRENLFTDELDSLAD